MEIIAIAFALQLLLILAIFTIEMHAKSKTNFDTKRSLRRVWEEIKAVLLLLVFQVKSSPHDKIFDKCNESKIVVESASSAESERLEECLENESNKAATAESEGFISRSFSGFVWRCTQVWKWLKNSPEKSNFSLPQKTGINDFNASLERLIETRWQSRKVQKERVKRLLERVPIALSPVLSSHQQEKILLKLLSLQSRSIMNRKASVLTVIPEMFSEDT